MNKMI